MTPEVGVPRLHQALRQTRLGDHLCPIYETDEVRVEVAATSLRIGLERNERCLFAADAGRAAAVLDALRDRGTDVERAIETGALVVAGARETYLRQGNFDPAAMIEFLSAQTAAAKAAGFTGLRLTGEMSWQLGGAPGSERLVEYEARLNDFLRHHDACVICQYDRRLFPPEVILDVIRTHPFVIYGSTVCRNPYYLPPEDYLKPGHAEREVKRLLHSLMERERADAQLAYQVSLLSSVNDAVVAADENLLLTSWNRAAEEMFGWHAEEVIGRRIEEVIRPAFSGGDRDRALAALRDQGRHELEVTASRKDGSPIDVRARIIALQGDEEEITGYVAAVRDISDRRQAETTLRETEDRMAGIIETAMDGIVSIDAEQRIVLLNPAAERMFGYRAADLLGRPLDVLIPEGLRATHRQHVVKFGQTGATARAMGALGTVSGLRASGEEFPLEASISQTTIGRSKLYTAILRDITMRRQAESRIERHLAQLAALRTIDTAISSSFDLRLTLNVLLEQVTTQLGVDAAGILLLHAPTQTLEYAAGRGFRSPAIQRARLRLGEGLAGRAALERQTVHVPDFHEVGGDSARAAELGNEGFVAYFGTPLVAKGQVRGVLELFHRSAFEPDEEWHTFLHTLAGQAAIAIDDIQMFEGLQRSNLELALAYDVTLEGWSRAMDLRDRETEGHTRRVTDLTLRIARTLGLADEELAHVRRGALLHDVGKLGIPDAILLKPGALTEEEWAVMRKHPLYAYEWLSPIAYLRPALAIPWCHHEKWDGSGYPRGLRAETIPLPARVFTVVDVYDALTSDRPYRKAWRQEDALQHIEEFGGVHFDPAVVPVFLASVQEAGPAI